MAVEGSAGRGVEEDVLGEWRGKNEWQGERGGKRQGETGGKKK